MRGERRRSHGGERRRRAVGLVTSVAVTAGVVAAGLLYDGVATADVDLNDGGVWVTHPSQSQVARLNYPVQELDAGLTAASTSFDVLQDGDDVFVVDGAAGVLQRVDVAAVTADGAINLPAERETGMGGGTIAVLDTASGLLRTAPTDSYGALADDEADPPAELGADAHVVVGTDGTAHGVAPGRAAVVSVPPGEEPHEADLGAEPGELEGAQLHPTAAGPEPVVVALAEDGDLRVLRPGAEPVDLTDLLPPASEVAVQHPSADGEEVVLATDTALARVPLDGGEPTVLEAPTQGRPARPVLLDGCLHAAWGGAEPTYLGQCGAAEPEVAPVETEVAQPELVFRTNRGHVVLNDMIAGTVWLPEDNMAIVDNWEDVTPPESTSEEEEQESQQEIRDQLPLDREQENRPPIAMPDTVGVRPGSTTVLEVLANDTDPDGDLLAVASHGSTGLGDVRAVLGGRALQVQVPDDATGSATVEYEAGDGRGGVTPSTATIEVVPESVNRPPEQLRDITLTLAAGASGSVNVMPDVRDPDGDEVMVTGVAYDGDDEVRFTPDGVVTFIDAGTATGRKDVVLTVSDSRETAEVVVGVEVLPASPLPPQPVFDYATATVGEEIVVEPIANDTDPNGEPLRLANVSEAPGATLVPDLDAGTVRFSAEQPGAYYLTYIVVDDSGQSATGLVRVEVQAPAEAAPVAVQDTALLPVGGQVLVDVLANDSDPSGRLLAVQQVDVPPDSGLVVSVLEHRILKVTATGAVGSTVRFGYTVSNGSTTARGEVVVLPVAEEGSLQPPVAAADIATVRAGDFITIPVLQNDSHPDGEEFRLAGLTEEPADPARQGRFFVSGETVRFRAPDQPQTVTAVYRIVDDRGTEASATVTVHVQAADAESNSAPQPTPLETRAFGGERIRIHVPMFGIDPDGDSVQLLGAEQAPRLGRIVEVGPGYLDYESYAHAVGTDEFTYAVRDRLGAVATAAVRVGVVPPPERNSAPEAVDDAVEVRPERVVEVDVLANDTDPDGDPLYLAEDGVDPVEGVEIGAVGSTVEMRTPAAEGQFSTGYRVTDQRGGQDTGVLTVSVSADAPLQAPVPLDDLVPDAEIVGHDAVTVPVLDNDADPDGTTDALVVDVLDAPEGVTVANDEIRVPLQPERQVILYVVTDVDGLTGYAFLDVPGTADTGPVLRPDAEPVVVTSGERVELPLADYVVAPSGRPVRLTSEQDVFATSSDGSSPVVDATTLAFTSAPGYAGQAALTFSVTDGTTTGEGLTSVLTLPITVESADGNTEPTFAGGEIEVAPAEDAATLNLRNLAEDPDVGDFNRLRYDLVSAPDGFDVTLDGPFLSVSAPAGTPRGTVGAIEVSVTDPAGAQVVGTVESTVVPSTRRLAVVADQDLGTVDQGETVPVNVLAGAYNPFPGEDLRVTSAAAVTGAAVVGLEGGTVSVTPGADYVGRVVVSVLVEDATGDPERRVTATLTMNVIGRPEAPSTPRVVEVGDRQVVLTWSAPASNGAPITGYTVTAAGRSWPCATTTCTITGLTNNVEYTFQVTATNSVGESDPSGTSAPARPDVRPSPPGVPELEFGDGQLTVTWAAAPTEGSPVESYDLQISPAVGSGQVSVTGTSYTWTGLENGTEYQVRARARNAAPDPSEWSAWSAGEIPAGPPGQPAAPAVERVDNAVAQQITASWQTPAANGDPIASYRVTVYRDGQRFSEHTAPGGTTSLTMDAPAGSDYTVTVAARNKAGQGPTSPQSRSVRSFAQPDRVGTVTAEATGNDGQVRLAFAEPAANGDPIRRYQVSVSGGAWQNLPSDRVVTGLADGTSYTLRVRACNTYCGPESAASNAVVPYGPLGQPSITAQRTADRQITFRWDGPDDNGRDITARQVRFRDGNGGWSGWQDVGDTGSARRGGAWSTTYYGEFRVERSDGQVRTAGAQARTANEPPPPTRPAVQMAKGGSAVGQPGCGHSSCAFLAVDYQDLPTGRYTIEFSASGESQNPWRRYTNVSLSGDGRYQSPSYRGNPGERVTVRVTGSGIDLSDSLTW